MRKQTKMRLEKKGKEKKKKKKVLFVCREKKGGVTGDLAAGERFWERERESRRNIQLISRKIVSRRRWKLVRLSE